jgi:integrating conjugative element protein (TIGR03761 family)
MPNEANHANHVSSNLPTDRKSPGPLRGETWINLQTRQAERLVAGRQATAERPAIIGLTRFGSLTSMLFFCARFDDPYADWWLIKVEDSLKHSNNEINDLQNQVEALLSGKPGMYVDIAESLSPVQVPLKFGNPYAYQGSALLTDFDALMRSVLTARHVGFLDRDQAESLIFQSGRAVRRAFTSAVGFHNQSIKRKDVTEKNARALKAIEFMGQVPEDILCCARRAKHAPGRISAEAQGLPSETLFDSA